MKPLRIGVDARRLNYRRGIGNVVHHLLREYARGSDDLRWIAYVDDPATLDLVPKDPRFSARLLRPKLYPLWEQRALPKAAAADDLDVLHCPGNSGPSGLGPRPALVLTVHDVMYLLPKSVLPPSPSWYQRLGRAYLKWAVPRAAAKARLVATVSEYSKQDLLKYLGVDASKVEVVYDAPGDAFLEAPTSPDAVLAKLGLRKPFVLALGGVDPRKNTDRVVEAFARMRGGRDLRLALVGHERRGLGEGVVPLGFLPEADLVALYRAAELLVYPSLYEGFGLPVVEAMACGLPVVTSSRGSLAEVAGDAALVADPESVDAIAEAMTRAADDGALRARLVAAGRERVKRFSWERSARRMIELYRRAAGG